MKAIEALTEVMYFLLGFLCYVKATELKSLFTLAKEMKTSYYSIQNIPTS